MMGKALSKWRRTQVWIPTREVQIGGQQYVLVGMTPLDNLVGVKVYDYEFENSLIVAVEITSTIKGEVQPIAESSMNGSFRNNENDESTDDDVIAEPDLRYQNEDSKGSVAPPETASPLAEQDANSEDSSKDSTGDSLYPIEEESERSTSGEFNEDNKTPTLNEPVEQNNGEKGAAVHTIHQSTRQETSDDRSVPKDILQEYTAKLACQLYTRTLAAPLLAANLINSDTAEIAMNLLLTENERGTKVLLALIRRLQARPWSFEKICEIFEEYGVPYVEDLRAEYRRRCGDVQQSRSGSYTSPDDAKAESLKQSTEEMLSELDVAYAERNLDIVPSITRKYSSFSENESSILHMACAGGHFGACECLLGAGTDVNKKDTQGNTALHTLCHAMNNFTMEQSHTEDEYQAMVQSLLTHGSKPEIQNQDNDTVLHVVCRGCNADLVEMLLNYTTISTVIQMRNKNGDTPLHVASRDGVCEIVKVLLNHNSDAVLPNKDQLTPLHLASQKGNSSTVELLRCVPGTIDSLDREYNTPLHHSCLYNHADVAEMLVKDRRVANKQNIEGNTPLHLACIQENVTIVRILLKSNCIPCISNNPKMDSNTPLHIAAATNNMDIVDELLKHDSSKPFLDAQNKQRETALHISCHRGYEGVVKKLLKKKASKNIENKDQKTPAQLASDREHQKIVKMLEGRISVFGISLPRRTTSLRKSESKTSIVTL